jgi:hypothetical protein
MRSGRAAIFIAACCVLPATAVPARAAALRRAIDAARLTRFQGVSHGHETGLDLTTRRRKRPPGVGLTGVEGDC